MRNVCRLVAGLAAGMLAMQGAWAQPYLGIGVASLSLDSQYASIDGRSGTGITLYGGYEFVPTWSVELSVSAADIDTGPTVNIFYPADSAEYSILRVSMRKSLWTLRERGWTPWVAVGVAYHYVNWDTFYYQLDGTGVSLGAGVDFGLAPSWRLRLQAMRNRFSARDTYGEGPFGTRSNELSASALYAFR
jgi:opacity protein-like surface antigen